MKDFSTANWVDRPIELCKSCKALRAKLDRGKLAKVVLGATHPTDEKPYTSYEEVADAIIAYMEGK